MTKERELIGWCVYCKTEIYLGDKVKLDENKNLLHEECEKLIKQTEEIIGS